MKPLTRYAMGTGMNIEPHMAPWPEGKYYRVDQVDARIAELEAELERERMRLAACGVVAVANTPESAARARDMHPDYRSAACDDVARMVDSEMAMRAERDAARADAERLRQDAERLDHIERTFSGMTNRERYLPVTMGWGKPCMGRTLREACDKYMKRDAARSKE